MPPPHSPSVSLRGLRSPPSLSRGKTKGFRQAVPRNTPPCERLPFCYIAANSLCLGQHISHAFSSGQLPVLLELAGMTIQFILLVVKFVLFLAEKFLYIETRVIIDFQIRIFKETRNHGSFFVLSHFPACALRTVCAFVISLFLS